MYKRYVFIFISLVFCYCSGKIQVSDVNQAERNKNNELDQNMNRILNLLEEKIPTLFLVLHELDTKITKELEWNRNCQADASKKMKDLEENINGKLDMLAKNISKALVGNNYFEFEALNNTQESINEKFNSLNKIITPKFEEILNIKLNDLGKNISTELKSNINCKSNGTKEVDDGKENNYNGTSMKTKPEENQLPCKEELLNGERYITPDYSMDNQTLHHVTVKRDSAGRLTYFELDVAIQADYYVDITLWDKDHSYICAIWIGSESNQYTDLYFHKSARVQRTHTPDILSSTQFRTFYVKVDDGTLQFGKEGDSSALISHYDVGFRSLEYFSLRYNGDNTSKIRYDCPHVPEFPCKEVSLSSYTPPAYLMENETLNHVTVQRDSAGRLTYFELHVAIQTDYEVAIWLEDKDHTAICSIYVGFDSNQYTDLHTHNSDWSTVQRTHTPDILSSTQFRAFYIKVDNGTVQFGKEGDSSALVSHYDASFRSLEYFNFLYFGHNTSKIRYDCPHVPESS